MTNRYENAKIYKLVDNDGFYYYGSTCLQLHKRYYSHKKDSKHKPDRKIYTIFTNERFLNGEINIVLVDDKFKVDNKEQLLKEENEYIENAIGDLKCLNSCRSVLNYEVRRQDMLKRGRLYRETHSEQIKADREARKEETKVYLKDYYEKNKNELLSKNKIYRELHKEKIDAYEKLKREERKQKITCGCGKIISKGGLKKHTNSLFHMNFISEKS